MTATLPLSKDRFERFEKGTYSFSDTSLAQTIFPPPLTSFSSFIFSFKEHCAAYCSSSSVSCCSSSTSEGRASGGYGGGGGDVWSGKKEGKKKEIASAHRERSGTRDSWSETPMARQRCIQKNKRSVSAAQLQPLPPPITF